MDDENEIQTTDDIGTPVRLTPTERRRGNSYMRTPTSQQSIGASQNYMATPTSQSQNNRNNISQTPLAFGTPRTPYLGNSRPSQYMNDISTPIPQRSDVGPGLSRVVVRSNSRLPPQTPENWRSHSHTGTPTQHGDSYEPFNSLPEQDFQSTQSSTHSTPTISVLDRRSNATTHFNTTTTTSTSTSRGNSNNSSNEFHSLPIENSQESAAGGGGGGPLASYDQTQVTSGDNEVYIWGTTIKTMTSANLFRNFIDNFTIGDDLEPFYLKQIESIHRSEVYILNLNCHHFIDYGVHLLYRQVINYPQDMILIFDKVIEDIYDALYGLTEGQPSIQTRIYGLHTLSSMRHLNPEDIEKLVAIKGMVVRLSPIIPDIQGAFFRCCICSHTTQVMIKRGKIDEPHACSDCQRLGSMQMIHNSSIYTDKQLVRLQETPDEIPEGETPYTISLFLFGDMVDHVRPGDRVEVTGVFRALPRRVNPKQRVIGSVFKTYIDCIHIRRADVTRDEALHTNITTTTLTTAIPPSISTNIQVLPPAQQTAADGSQMDRRHFTTTRIQQFHEFANSGNVYNKLVQAFAPSIWELDDVKRGILCLLFGGTLPEARLNSMKRKKMIKKRKRDMDRMVTDDDDDNEGDEGQVYSQKSGTNSTFDDILNEDSNTIRQQILSIDQDDKENDDYNDIDPAEADSSMSTAPGKLHQRGDINILLCGDPGTSKSQLLSYVHKISPRGIYTSGKGSSAVGLTASVVRDPETKDMVLESGALVLSDNGICCIDEFDKMSDTTRAILHEAMEQQTVSITKAGIIATLNARASILASANPVQSRYNPRMSVVENIKLPPSLLSRFDLIYLILDTPEADKDRRLANHLVSLYYPEDSKNPRHTKKGVEVDQAFLKDYIAYARGNIAPEVTEEAIEVLVQGYISMRSIGHSHRGGSKTITATPRQLESLIRISQALAKMRLSELVLKSDVEEAIRLMRVATQTAATDPRTGTIDMDMITTGKSALDRDLIFKLGEQIRVILSTRSGRLTIGQVRQLLLQESGHNNENKSNGYNNSYNPTNDLMMGVTMSDIEEAVREMESEGLLQFIPRTQTIIIRTEQ